MEPTCRNERTSGEWTYETCIGESGRMSVRILKSSSPEPDVVLPEEIDGMSVTWIGARAFIEAPIRSVRFPETLVGIEAEAFLGCRRLAEIRLPSSLRIVRNDAFRGCRSLVRVDFPEGLMEIGTVDPMRRSARPGGAFEDCTRLVDVHIPDTVVVMAKNSFKGCTNLKSIRMPRHIIPI